jgi:hypothetical protein
LADEGDWAELMIYVLTPKHPSPQKRNIEVLVTTPGAAALALKVNATSRDQKCRLQRCATSRRWNNACWSPGDSRKTTSAPTTRNPAKKQEKGNAPNPTLEESERRPDNTEPRITIYSGEIPYAVHPVNQQTFGE